MRHLLLVVAVAALAGTNASAAVGPFDPAAGQPGSFAVSKDSASITNWATGYVNYLPGGGVDAEFRTPAKALGKAAGDAFDVVSLGNGGSITLTFAGSIFNGAGDDFAVFENAFSATFLELARVEVSSNGTDFFRFPAYSFTPKPVGPFSESGVDPTNIAGFAGKYVQGYGTPFDLDALSGTLGLNVNDVRYVRVVDVIGNGTEFDDYPAYYNGVPIGGPHAIYDPYPTTGSAGFDLDAIGVIHLVADAVVIPPVVVIPTPVPEPEQYALFVAGLALLARVAQRRRVRTSQISIHRTAI